MYGKQTETAIASLSRLAEVWDGGKTRLSAADIADQRGLPKAMVAKILSTLSQAGLVQGNPGPGGGYALARDPKAISLREAFDLFEREERSSNCPFGGGVCGVGEPCALHTRLVTMQSAVRKLLDETNLEIFRKAVQEDGLIPVAKGIRPDAPRESYRAPASRRKAT
ncbi:MAG: Rrf2 family transcriptional regulator [Limnohabitans sp.]|jgi:Rrf2 family iron-sulfur cluster assembly transcriptional regulator|nr:Rrf2 family transcriptional regulator [Limnohabitans sp.]